MIHSSASILFLILVFSHSLIGQKLQSHQFQQLVQSQDTLQIVSFLKSNQDQLDQLSDQIIKKEGPDSLFSLYEQVDLMIANVSPVLAEVLAKHYLKISKQEGIRQKEAMALYLIGCAQFDLGNYPDCISNLIGSLSLIEQLEDEALEGKVLNMLASAYSSQSESDRAIEYHLRSIELAEKVGNDRLVMMNTLNIFQPYYMIGEIETAKEYLLEARALGRKLGVERAAAYASGNLAYILSEEGAFKEALKYQKEGLEYEKKIGDKLAMIDSHGVLALCYAGLRDTSQMKTHFELSKNYAFELQANNKLLDILSEEYAAYADLGMYELAYNTMYDYHHLYDSLFQSEKNELTEDLKEKYHTEQKEAQNEMLASQNSIQKYIIYLALALLLVILIFAYFVYRNYVVTKQLNQKISSQSLELQKSNQTKDRLFSIIGHDLRGPITSFESLSEIVNNYLKKGDLNKVQEVMEHVQHATKNLKNLLENLLNWSLRQQDAIELDIKPHKLKPLIDEVAEFYAEICRVKNIQMVSRVEDEKVLADYDTLSTVVRNLVSNAIKFSNPGAKIEIMQEKTDQFVQVAIKDYGVGIEENRLSDLFSINKSKVREGTSREKGTGLGLVLVKEFVELNNGFLEIDSSPGKGTTFYVNLPLAS